MSTSELPPSASVNTNIHGACSAFDINNRKCINSLTQTLDDISKLLAQDRELRQQIGEGEPSIWPDLRKLWRDLCRAQLTFWDGDDSEEEDSGASEQQRQKNLRQFCTSLAKFTRNLVAQVPDNQNQAFDNEVDIRRLVHYHTSWTAIKDEESFPVTRILVQTLANIVTANEDLMTKLWNTYLQLSEDQAILIRLLSSPDARTVFASLVLILNCIHGSKVRSKLLCRTTIGHRICVSLLDDMVKLYDAEESSDAAKAFDIGYEIFIHLVEDGLVPDLYSKFSIDGEIVTPHQKTLLKLVDSYLQSAEPSQSTVQIGTIHKKFSPMLSNCFFTLSVYAQNAMKRALGPATHIEGSTANAPTPDSLTSRIPFEHPPSQLAGAESPGVFPPANLDSMLPMVCEALVLVSQCVSTITLDAENQKSGEVPNHDTSTSTRTASGFANLRDYFNETRYNNQGFIENLIELLRLLDNFLPRINFGKSVPVISPHVNGGPMYTDSDPSGFVYLKRDLVRLLGILCHGVKAVQDRVRDCGGIQVIMNLCVVDERNPYLREHAIFTLHNLLENNIENQAVVDSIKPMGTWDEYGVLHDRPGAVRR